MEKQEARNLLKNLARTGKPPSSTKYYLQYTVGDEFRSLARRFETEIVNLSIESQGYSPMIVLGDFGIGKTHFLRYLYLKLGEIFSSATSTDDTICSWIELRELKNDTDFQYLFITGLSFFQNEFPNEYQYLDVLKTAYKRLANPIANERQLSESQKNIYRRKRLDWLWDVASLNPVSIPFKWFANWTLREDDKKRLKRIQDESIKEEMNRSAYLAKQDEFIYSLIRLGEEKSSNPSAFDSTLLELAKQAKDNNLIDVLLRILNKAGYKRVVILIDEMEHIKAFENKDLIYQQSQRTAEILNLFHRLHTKLSWNAGKNDNDGYPSIAQVMVMPDYLEQDVVRLIDPALHDIWRPVEFPLNIISEDSLAANELIVKIWELHEEAGYKLKPASANTFQEIKKTLYRQINNLSDANGKVYPATMRHLIPLLVDIIDKHWKTN